MTATRQYRESALSACDRAILGYELLQDRVIDRKITSGNSGVLGGIDQIIGRQLEAKKLRGIVQTSDVDGWTRYSRYKPFDSGKPIGKWEEEARSQAAK